MRKELYQAKTTIIGISFLLFMISPTTRASLYPFSATYSGANEVPPNASTGTGTIVGVYNDVTNTIFYTITFSGMSSNVTAAHFHAPGAPGVSAPVIIPHVGFPTGVTFGTYNRADVLTDAQETQLMNGLIYSNIHTTTLGLGEIRAQINLGPASPLIYSFSRTYSGTNEVPSNTSSGTGTIKGAYNSVTNTIFYTITFSSLSANSVAAHFHAPAPPGVIASVVIAHAGFPTGVTSGSYFKSDVLNDGQETSLLAGLFYSNIHTTTLTAGEIRTQIFFDAPFVAPTITCPSFASLATDPGACSRSVTFAATTTGDPAPTVTFRVGTTVITSPHTFPLGTTTVTATALNGGGFATCSFDVTIVDLEPPVISNLNANPNSLWPPNHKMKDVTVNYTSTDNCPGVTTCNLTVTSNEPVNGTGDGDTAPDWIIVDNHHVKLRAERSGNGNGRVYTITAHCTDQNGNTSTKATTVRVAHDASNHRGLFVLGEDDGNQTIVQVLPNPSHNYFTLNIETVNVKDKISVRLVDIAGRIVEIKNNISGSQALKVGASLKPGVYFAEIKQGNSTRQIKLVKME